MIEIILFDSGNAYRKTSNGSLGAYLFVDIIGGGGGGLFEFWYFKVIIDYLFQLS